MIDTPYPMEVDTPYSVRSNTLYWTEGWIRRKGGFQPERLAQPLLKDAEAKDVDVHLYRSMIGSLMYLTASRPDIVFVVCACARFQVIPKVSHLHVVKRIFRYLKGQPKLGLWYPKDSLFDLEAYTDSDYAVSNSTTEAEYVAASSCCGHVLWIQNQMLDYGYNFMNTKIFIDNEIIICIVKNPVFHSKTKKAKRPTEISQSSRPIPLVADETVIKEWEDIMERAATIASSLEAEHASGNINRTQSMATLNESFPQGTDLGSDPKCQDTILGGAEAQIRFEVASKHSNDPPLLRVNTLGSGEDSMKLKELMEFSYETVINKWEDRMEKDATTASSLEAEHDSEIATLKDIVKKMEKKSVLNGDKVFQEPMVNTATTTSSIPVSAADPVTTAGEVVTTASVEIPEELTLAQTLIEIKSAKPKAVTTAATTVTPASSRPKAKGIVFHDQEEQAPASTPIVSPLQLPQAKDKGKAKMVEPEKPLKKKDQIAIDEEVARNLEAQLQAELEEEERLSRQKEEEANIALIESWDNTQAMMDADFQLAQQMQTEEQEQLSIEEKSKLFVELLEKRKKHFAALRA
ncbi:hypothetical protein Tco_0216147 [Tanacetum coccineum]